MKKKIMRFRRAVAGVMSAVLLLFSLPNITGVAAQEVIPAETEIPAGYSENVDAFLTAGSDLPETLTQDNYLPTTTSLGWLMDLYSKLSEEEKSMGEVQTVYARMQSLIAQSYSTQTLEVGYYTDHNVIMKMPAGFLGVDDWDGAVTARSTEISPTAFSRRSVWAVKDRTIRCLPALCRTLN